MILKLLSIYNLIMIMILSIGVFITGNDKPSGLVVATLLFVAPMTFFSIAMVIKLWG